MVIQYLKKMEIQKYQNKLDRKNQFLIHKKKDHLIKILIKLLYYNKNKLIRMLKFRDLMMLLMREKKYLLKNKINFIKVLFLLVKQLKKLIKIIKKLIKKYFQIFKANVFN